MFNSKKGSQISGDTNSGGKMDTTIIGSSSSFDGTLNSSGIIRVDGSFSGELNIEGNVIIGDSGYVNGNIHADKITIAGKVEGNINCRGALELTANGELHGDIEVRTINIEDGAIFQGRCTMINPTAASQVTYDNVELLVDDNSTTLSE